MPWYKSLSDAGDVLSLTAVWRTSTHFAMSRLWQDLDTLNWLHRRRTL